MGSAKIPGRPAAGRPSAVWWWGARKRWTINVRGKRRTAPPTIGILDRTKAERWARDLLTTEAPDQLPKELAPGDRVRKEIKMQARTAGKLRKLVVARREATGKPVDESRVMVELIEQAYRDLRPAGGPAKNPGEKSDDAVDT